MILLFRLRIPETVTRPLYSLRPFMAQVAYHTEEKIKAQTQERARNMTAYRFVYA